MYNLPIKRKNMAIARTKCIICGNKGYFIKQGGHERMPDKLWNIYKCGGCRVEFCYPMPDKAQLNSFYKGYSDARATKEVLIKTGQKNIKRLKRYGVGKASSLLDFGCGRGVFTQLGGEKWKKFDQYTCYKPELLQAGKYICVTLWGVLEHVTDPVGVLKDINRYLRPAGYVVLTTVNTETGIPYQHKPPEHLLYWTEQALVVALKKAGFKMTACEPYVMAQKRDVYMNAVLRTVPKHLKRRIDYTALPETIKAVPTNEVFVVGKKTVST